MKVLVTGSEGYIGRVLVKSLIEKGYQVIGLDTNYYKGCELYTDSLKFEQINKDIRLITKKDLEGVGVIIHLAALSNDSLCEFNPQAAFEINFAAAFRLAQLAKSADVTRFILASSQGMYGVAKKVVTEDSPKNPKTVYAKSKLAAEEEISKLANTHFTPVFLRLTTVAGISPMLRCDILLNSMVAQAVTTGKIRVIQNREIWRAAIHVEDVACAIIAALEAPQDLVFNQAFNVGENYNNFSVEEFAKQVSKIVGAKIEYFKYLGQEPTSYKVSFDKINSVLANYFQPKWDIKGIIFNLYNFFKLKSFSFAEINKKFIRLNKLAELSKSGKLDKNLFLIQNK